MGLRLTVVGRELWAQAQLAKLVYCTKYETYFVDLTKFPFSALTHHYCRPTVNASYLSAPTYGPHQDSRQDLQDTDKAIKSVHHFNPQLASRNHRASLYS
jgi:hypothetical protein